MHCDIDFCLEDTSDKLRRMEALADARKEFSFMIRVLFICHGNICRSTMAQFVFQDMVNMSGLADQFLIDSAATSTEEIGNPPHRDTIRKMNAVGIPILPHRARQITRSDYQKFDYIIGMDTWNMRNLNQKLNGDPDGKLYKLLTFAGSDRDIADPWYTGNFDETYEDVKEGCTALLAFLEKHVYSKGLKRNGFQFP